MFEKGTLVEIKRHTFKTQYGLVLDPKSMTCPDACIAVEVISEETLHHVKDDPRSSELSRQLVKKIVSLHQFDVEEVHPLPGVPGMLNLAYLFVRHHPESQLSVQFVSRMKDKSILERIAEVLKNNDGNYDVLQAIGRRLQQLGKK
jgi:hypothetical protein